MNGWIAIGIAAAFGIAIWITVHTRRTPEPPLPETGISDSSQVERILYRLGLVDVDLSRCIRTDTIDGRVRIVTIFLDGRRLPGVYRKRTWKERWGKRPVYLAGISNLTELRELKLANVAVFELPEEIGLLDKLSYLEISNGRLSSLPDSLGKASSLEFLYLQNNRISVLPNSACALDRLRVLMVAGNPQIHLPSGRCLENLSTLYIDRSQFERVPEHLRDRIRYTTVKAD